MATNTAVKTKIISISLPQLLVKQAQETAMSVGKSRSRLFQDALQQYVTLSQWKTLQAYGVSRAIKKQINLEDTNRFIDEYRNERAKIKSRL